MGYESDSPNKEDDVAYMIWNNSLVTALGNTACQKGCRKLYASTAKLMNQLKIAKIKGSILAELKRIERSMSRA